MPYTVKGYADDHLLTAVAETEREAIAKAVEWFMTERLSEITISDGFTSRPVEEVAGISRSVSPVNNF